LSDNEVVKILKTRKKLPCEYWLAKWNHQKLVESEPTIANQAKSMLTPW
jgi:hypothetical protein